MSFSVSQLGVLALAVLTFLIPLFFLAFIGARAVWRKYKGPPKRIRARDLWPQHIQQMLMEKARLKRIRRGLRRLWEKYCGGWGPRVKVVQS